jgi:aconitate hydratase 2/2-methylisocitrate dehydratase
MMDLYSEYLNEINDRKTQGLQPKPIDNGALLDAIIANIKGPI